MSESFYLLAADSILVVHALCVVFVVLGLFLIIAGKFLRWSWVRKRWFRIIHLATIVVVVVQSWLGVICPLTTWEMVLREKGGEAAYQGTFISYWLTSLLYYEADAWVFILVYTLFGSAVVVSWFWVRPDSFTNHHELHSGNSVD